MGKTVNMPAGIDDLAIYVPKLYIDYKDFALARGIDPQKLEHGIGIKNGAGRYKSRFSMYGIQRMS